MRNIKISPEFQCSPIWISDDTNQPFTNIDIEDLDISEELKTLVRKWDKDYQSIYNSLYPPDSSFKNKEDGLNFEKSGICIWEMMKKEVREYIIYYSILLNKEYDDIKQFQIDLDI